MFQVKILSFPARGNYYNAPILADSLRVASKKMPPCVMSTRVILLYATSPSLILPSILATVLKSWPFTTTIISDIGQLGRRKWNNTPTGLLVSGKTKL